MKRIAKICFVLLCGSLMMQSFECASPEMTTAKTKISQKDFAAAKISLERELAKNPNNGEAWLMLARTNRELKDNAGMVNAFTQAEKTLLDEKLKQQLAAEKYNAWVELYNASIESYNSYTASKSSADIEKALEIMNFSAQVKPDIPENHSLMARMYEAQGDTNRAIESYNRYMRLQQPGVNFAREKGIYINMPLSAARNILGAPKSGKAKPSSIPGDSIMTEMYTIGENTLYLFSNQKASEKTFKVVGWRINPPTTWLPGEREQFASFDVDPYVAMTNINIGRKNYDQALSNLESILVFDPANEAAMQQRIQIYQDLGRGDEAIRLAEDLIAKNPGNKMAQLQYANMMMRMNKNNEAIAGYERVLNLDPQNENALYYIGAAYVNRAADIQKEEKKKLEADPKYKMNDSKYLPDLKKAAGYFDQYSELPGKQNDFRPLQQLANIYEVTQEKDKIRQLMAQFEALESVHSANYEYWNALGRMYTRQNMAEKAKNAYAKADQLLKK